MHARRTPVVLMLAASTLGAAPAEAPAKTPVVIESLDRLVDFQNDGSCTRAVTGVIHIQGESALKQWAVLVLPYLSHSSTLDVDYVRVRKADGTLVVTPPEAIRDLSASVVREAPMYSDCREKHVAVKGLGVGDTLEYRLVEKVSRPEVPGQFWVGFEGIQENVVRKYNLQLSFPADRPVIVADGGVAPQERREGGRRILRWTLANAEAHEAPARAAWKGRAPEPYQLTSFRSWEELGTWYRGLVEPQMAVTPAIKKKAEELTRGLAGDRERIEALYAFVSSRIHYVGISFGLGRYQPHSADEVLANGYGDCKDKHTLLAALLRAQGIEAWPALIRAGGDIDPRVPSPSQVDHVITVVPQGAGRLWLDTTPGVGPFGFLSVNLRGKPALVIPAKGPAQLVATPARPDFPMTCEYTFKGKLDAGGTLTGHGAYSARGDAELNYRWGFSQTQPQRWQEVMGQATSLPGLGNQFTGIQTSALDDARDPFTFSWDLKREIPSDGQAGRVILPLPVFNLAGVAQTARKASDSIFLPSDTTYVYRAELELPPGCGPVLPDAVNLTHPLGEYHASYRLDQGRLTVERRLVLHPGEVIPKDRAAFFTFSQGVSDDEQRYFMLGQGTGSARAQDPEAARLFDSGLEAMRRNDLQGARKDFRKALEKDPDMPMVHGAIGVTCLYTGDMGTGVEEMLREEALHPEQISAYQTLGDFYQSKGMQKEAIHQWQKGFDRDPDNSQIFMSLMGGLRRTKRHRDAVANLEKAIARSPGELHLHLLMAKIQGVLGNAEASLEAARRAVAIDGMGQTLGMAAGALVDVAPVQARAYAEKASALLDAESCTLKDDPGKALQTTEGLVRVWQVLGHLNLKEGHLPEAERYLRSAWSVSLDGESGDLLAQLYERQGLRKEAIRQYELAAVAPESDAEIATRYRKLTGKALENGFGHFYKNGKMLPSPADHLKALRRKGFPCSQALGMVEAVLEVSAAGIEGVRFSEPSLDWEAQVDNVKKARLGVVFPDGSPRRIFMKGRLAFEAHSGTFILGGWQDGVMNPVPGPAR